MTQPKDPQEFFLHEEGLWYGTEEYPEDESYSEIKFHAIEYKAYEALQSKLEKAEAEALAQLEINKALLRRIDLLETENKRLRTALEFYSLKSNYSIVDEGRNYSVDYKCYELNEKTYADEELGTLARQALKGEGE